MMSDASKAMLKATKQCLPETINLMCWFHLRMNIRKHKPLIGKDAYESVMKDVSTLHNSTCEATFKLQLNSINSKWVREGLVEFKEYFNKQWIKSAFNKWQIYHTPPGLAQTNNPVETYNSTIKTHFTNRVKFNMQPALEKFKEVLAYESNRKDKVMVFEGTVTTGCAASCKTRLLKHNKLELRGDYYSYRQCNGDVFNIDVANKDLQLQSFSR
jgi:transposase-like protein